MSIIQRIKNWLRPEPQPPTEIRQELRFRFPQSHICLNEADDECVDIGVNWTQADLHDFVEHYQWLLHNDDFWQSPGGFAMPWRAK